jgi:hypothetical protein
LVVLVVPVVVLPALAVMSPVLAAVSPVAVVAPPPPVASPSSPQLAELASRHAMVPKSETELDAFPMSGVANASNDPSEYKPLVRLEEPRCGGKCAGSCVLSYGPFLSK